MSNAIIKKHQIKMQQIQDELREFQTYVDGITTPTASQVSTTKSLLADVERDRAVMLEIFRELASLDTPVEEDSRSKYTRSYIALYERAVAITAATPDNATPVATPVAAPVNARLPEIALPKFSGAYQAWLNFRDTFLLLVGNNASLTHLQKLHYLRGHLEGEAHQLIIPTPLSDAGYDIAWAKLMALYENNRFIIKRHVQELLNLPATKRESYRSIRGLINAVELNLAALRQMKRPIDTWDDLLIELIVRSLDQGLGREWEGKHSHRIPTLADLLTFLQSKALELEASFSAVGREIPTMAKPHRAFAISNGDHCAICGKNHYTFRCPVLLNQTVQQRRHTVMERRLCFNCLRKGHQCNECPSGLACRKCNARHHTILHLDTEDAPPVEPDPPAIVGNVGNTGNCTMLSTCMVKIFDARGQAQCIRALLDGGSEVNLITAACAKRLGLRQSQISQPLTIAGGGTTSATGIAKVDVCSWRTPFTCKLDALVIPRIMGQIPSRRITTDSLRVPSTIPLADPDFGTPSPVELLIGNGIFLDLLIAGRMASGGVRFQNTVFGWIIGGRHSDPPTASSVLTVSLSRLDERITRFWEMETFENDRPQNPEERRCEEHFEHHTARHTDGRVVVCLPFKDDPGSLPSSSQRARQAFLALERRLSKNPETYDRYRAFMHEYETLGHMSPTVGDPMTGYYLPHHCVLKEASLTTKLRIVFNGSFPTSNGKSLNQLLMVGPRLQDDLPSILIRMRCHKYILTADITKMYRQILVRPEDRLYQRIWWRPAATQALRSFELNTVTYGTASASYLAIKALRMVATERLGDYPLGAQRCLDDFYVDNLITGSDSISELAELRSQIIAVLASGGFTLSKWACNHRSILLDDAALPTNVILGNY